MGHTNQAIFTVSGNVVKKYKLDTSHGEYDSQRKARLIS